MITVEKLIEELQKVIDKKKEVGVYSKGFGGSYDDIINVSEDLEGVYIETE